MATPEKNPAGPAGTPPLKHKTFKDQAKEMARVYRKEFVRNWLLFKESKIGVVGLVVILFFVFMAILAPILPYANSRDPIRWQGPPTDYTEIKWEWEVHDYDLGVDRYYVSDSDPYGHWGTQLTPSAVVFAPLGSGVKADMILQGSEKGLFGIAPRQPCSKQGPVPTNPCLPGSDIRKNMRIEDIGQVIGAPIANSHSEHGVNNELLMWKARVYATTVDGKLYSFRINRDTSIQPPSPCYAPCRALEHGGTNGTKQVFDAGEKVNVGPVFDYLGDCNINTLPIPDYNAGCMNTVFVVTESKIIRVRERIWNESKTKRYPWAGEWTQVWNLSYSGFGVAADPIFMPANRDLGNGQETVSMLATTGTDGRLHAYVHNNSNMSSPKGEEAWVWPDPSRPDDCYAGDPARGPLNSRASPASLPRGYVGELKKLSDHVYVSSVDGKVFAIDMNGRCIRTYDVGDNTILWTPNVVEDGGELQVGGDNTYVYDFYAEATSGNNTTIRRPVWSYKTTSAVTTKPFTSNTFLSNRVFVANQAGTVYLLKAERGVGRADRVFNIQFPVGSVANPLITLETGGLKHQVLITTKDGRMGIFDDAGKYLAPLPPGCYEKPGTGRTCYPLGSDFLGRDVLSQLIWGSQLALMIGFLAAFFSIAIGLVVGLVAGYFGGKIDAVLMRFTDVILVLPGLPFLIVLASVLGPNIFNLVLVIALIGWPGTARIIRAEVLSLKERPYVDAARITGASHTRIMFKHIAPNVFPLVFLFLTFAVSGAIISEASLSFIGLGDTNRMSWGVMLYYAQYTGNALTAWWWLLPPGLAITFISLGFFLVGRAFEQIINPRLRRR